MRNVVTALALSTAVLAPLTLASAAFGQSSAPVDGRVDKLEREMRAVQRKVFPGGVPLEPELRAQPPVPVAVGTPAASPIADLTTRVDTLERQLATMTGQIEQNSYKLQQLEDAFAAYKAEMDGRLSGGTVIAPPPAIAPTRQATTPAPAPAPVATNAPAPANAAAGEARKVAVATIERPDTGDAANDAYAYGFRLWSAKFYPEAQVQLKGAVDKHGSGPIGSRIQNLLGRAYLDDGKPAQAAVTLYENYQKRPSGDRAADSLAWLGEALIQLRKLPDACKVYGELEQNYGTSMSSTLRDMMTRGRARAKCG